MQAAVEVKARVAAAGVSIDLDKSVLLQMVVFAVLVVVLKPLLFDPILRIFALREERTDGAKAEARRLQVRAGKLLRRYEKELERVQEVAAEERERIRRETSRQEAAILQEARDVTNQLLAEGRAKIEKEVTAIRFELGKESERVAQNVVEKVFGREVGG